MGDRREDVTAPQRRDTVASEGQGQRDTEGVCAEKQLKQIYFEQRPSENRESVERPGVYQLRRTPFYALEASRQRSRTIQGILDVRRQRTEFVICPVREATCRDPAEATLKRVRARVRAERKRPHHHQMMTVSRCLGQHGRRLSLGYVDETTLHADQPYGKRMTRLKNGRLWHRVGGHPRPPTIPGPPVCYIPPSPRQEMLSPPYEGVTGDDSADTNLLMIDLPDYSSKFLREHHVEQIEARWISTRKVLNEVAELFSPLDYLLDLKLLYEQTQEKPLPFFLSYLGPLFVPSHMRDDKTIHWDNNRETLREVLWRMETIPLSHLSRMSEEIRRLLTIVRDKVLAKIVTYKRNYSRRLNLMVEIIDWGEITHKILSDQIEVLHNKWKKKPDVSRHKLYNQLINFMLQFQQSVKHTTGLAQKLNLAQLEDSSIKIKFSDVDLNSKKCPVELDANEIPGAGVLLQSREKFEWSVKQLTDMLWLCVQLTSDDETFSASLESGLNLFTNAMRVISWEFDGRERRENRISQLHKKLSSVCHQLEESNATLVSAKQTFASLEHKLTEVKEKMKCLMETNVKLEEEMTKLKEMTVQQKQKEMIDQQKQKEMIDQQKQKEMIDQQKEMANQQKEKEMIDQQKEMANQQKEKEMIDQQKEMANQEKEKSEHLLQDARSELAVEAEEMQSHISELEVQADKKRRTPGQGVPSRTLLSPSTHTLELFASSSGNMPKAVSGFKKAGSSMMAIGRSLKGMPTVKPMTEIKTEPISIGPALAALGNPLDMLQSVSKTITESELLTGDLTEYQEVTTLLKYKIDKLQNYATTVGEHLRDKGDLREWFHKKEVELEALKEIEKRDAITLAALAKAEEVVSNRFAPNRSAETLKDQTKEPEEVTSSAILLATLKAAARLKKQRNKKSEKKSKTAKAALRRSSKMSAVERLTSPTAIKARKSASRSLRAVCKLVLLAPKRPSLASITRSDTREPYPKPAKLNLARTTKKSKSDSEVAQMFGSHFLSRQASAVSGSATPVDGREVSAVGTDSVSGSATPVDGREVSAVRTDSVSGSATPVDGRKVSALRTDSVSGKGREDMTEMTHSAAVWMSQFKTAQAELKKKFGVKAKSKGTTPQIHQAYYKEPEEYFTSSSSSSSLSYSFTSPEQDGSAVIHAEDSLLDSLDVLQDGRSVINKGTLQKGYTKKSGKMHGDFPEKGWGCAFVPTSARENKSLDSLVRGMLQPSPCRTPLPPRYLYQGRERTTLSLTEVSPWYWDTPRAAPGDVMRRPLKSSGHKRCKETEESPVCFDENARSSKEKCNLRKWLMRIRQFKPWKIKSLVEHWKAMPRSVRKTSISNQQKLLEHIFRKWLKWSKAGDESVFHYLFTEPSSGKLAVAEQHESQSKSAVNSKSHPVTLLPAAHTPQPCRAPDRAQGQYEGLETQIGTALDAKHKTESMPAQTFDPPVSEVTPPELCLAILHQFLHVGHKLASFLLDNEYPEPANDVWNACVWLQEKLEASNPTDIVLNLEDTVHAYFKTIQEAVQRSLEETAVRSAADLLQEWRERKMEERNNRAKYLEARQAELQVQYQQLWVMHLNLCQMTASRRKGVQYDVFKNADAITLIQTPLTECEEDLSLPKDFLTDNTALLKHYLQQGVISHKCYQVGKWCLLAVKESCNFRLPLLVQLYTLRCRYHHTQAVCKQRIALYAHDTVLHVRWQTWRQRLHATYSQMRREVKQKVKEHLLKRKSELFKAWYTLTQILLESGARFILPEPRQRTTLSISREYDKLLTQLVQARPVPQVNSRTLSDLVAHGLPSRPVSHYPPLSAPQEGLPEVDLRMQLRPIMQFNGGLASSQVAIQAFRQSDLRPLCKHGKRKDTLRTEAQLGPHQSQTGALRPYHTSSTQSLQ